MLWLFLTCALQHAAHT